MTGAATMQCPRCRVQVPAAKFCGRCGCQGGHLPILRPAAFGAEPGERVLRPFLSSSLFPHLPDRARTPFRATLAVAAAGLVLAVVLRLPALGISISALGLPLLFVLYLRVSAAYRDCPRSALVLAGSLGALLGAGWVLVSGQLVARTYGVPMSVGLALHHLIREGFLIPAAGMVLMIVPTAVVRLTRPCSRESLDGFMIGALAGLTFSAAATFTRLAPQVVTGLIDHTRPLRGLLVEVVLCGGTVPVTAAAAGGTVGIALWFRQRPGVAERHGRVHVVLALVAAVAMLAHTAAAVVDIMGPPDVVMLTAHLTGAVLILLLLRIALQLALLHETTDPVDEDQPLLCLRCETVVPDMAFCPACGAATRAASRQSRRERRGARHPEPVGHADPAPGSVVYPGYAMPADSYAAPPVRRPRLSWLVGRWGIVITAATVVLAGATLVLTPKIARYMCPPDCGQPPTGTPVMALPRFAAPDGSFTVSYPAPGSAYTISTHDAGVTATYTGGDGGVM